MKESSIEEDIKILENMNDGYTFKDCDMCNNYNEKTKCCDKHKCMELQAIERVLLDYKRILKENETYKKQYFCLIDKIENKIDKFDYEFEKVKRKNYQERADYYWDLIRNFKKLLESEE